MKKTIMYQYLGTNGTILSPVHLEDVYYVRKVQLRADTGKILVNGNIRRRLVTVPEDEVPNWSEEELGQN